MQSYQKNFVIIKEPHFLLTLVFIKYNFFFFQVATRHGVFWTQRLSNILSIVNIKKNLLIKNNINKIAKASIYYNLFLILLYNACVCIRRYFRLKGLGFSLKYLRIPASFMLLTLGFSIPTFAIVPVYVSLVKRPEKKKVFLQLEVQKCISYQFLLECLKN